VADVFRQYHNAGRDKTMPVADFQKKDRITSLPLSVPGLHPLWQRAGYIFRGGGR
jgi:hypothetical protein